MKTCCITPSCRWLLYAMDARLGAVGEAGKKIKDLENHPLLGSENAKSVDT